MAQTTITADAISLGAQLRQLREAADVPARVPAAAAEIESSLLSKIENGKRPVTPSQLAALAKFYGVDLEPLETKRVAEDMRRRYGSHPGFAAAAAIVEEEAGEYRVKKTSTTGSKPARAANNPKKKK